MLYLPTGETTRLRFAVPCACTLIWIALERYAFSISGVGVFELVCLVECKQLVVSRSHALKIKLAIPGGQCFNQVTVTMRLYQQYGRGCKIVSLNHGSTDGCRIIPQGDFDRRRLPAFGHSEVVAE
jgi:hypothetical protein